LIVRRYSQELFHFLYRLLGSAAAAEDICQETFLQVHLAADKFDPGRRFRPWVFTIAANKARDYLRSQKRRPEMPLDARAERSDEDAPSFAALLGDDVEMPALAMEAEELSFRIRRMVEQLPSHLKEVLILGYYHGFAYKDMASILNVPLGTIKSRLHAAVATMAKFYASSEPADAEAGY
jgi:RNA polymerase sigma-70 factor (ECF subfamily)